MPETELEAGAAGVRCHDFRAQTFPVGRGSPGFLLVYLPGLFRPALPDHADATHAEAAREMMASGDFITLHVNGVRYLEKAPLPYWLAGLSDRAFGVSEFSTRLPTFLAVLLSVTMASIWALRAFGRRAGVYAGCSLAPQSGLLVHSHIHPGGAAEPVDRSVSLLLLDRPGSARKESMAMYAGYASVALAVLSKGLIGIVFVGLSAAGYLLCSGE